MDASTTAGDNTAKKRRPADGPAPTSEEEEVEEFFAILRRIHVAVKYFEKSGARAGSLLSGKRCRPSFGVEIDDGGNREVAADYKEVAGEAGSEVDGAGLDLNSDPPPDVTAD